MTLQRTLAIEKVSKGIFVFFFLLISIKDKVLFVLKGIDLRFSEYISINIYQIKYCHNSQNSFLNTNILITNFQNYKNLS